MGQFIALLTYMKQAPMRKLLLLFYLLALFYVTLLAWNYGASLGPEGPGGRNYNLTPFRSIYRISVFSKDVMDPIRILLGNIILFVPLGFLVPLAIPKFSRSIIQVVLIGALVSIFIEVSQFAFTHRVSNIDDVILNTLGAFIGVAMYHWLRKIKRRFIVFYE